MSIIDITVLAVERGADGSPCPLYQLGVGPYPRICPAFIGLNFAHKSIHAGYALGTTAEPPYPHIKTFPIPANASVDSINRMMHGDALKDIFSDLISLYNPEWDGSKYVVKFDKEGGDEIAARLFCEAESLLSDEDDYSLIKCYEADKYLKCYSLADLTPKSTLERCSSEILTCRADYQWILGGDYMVSEYIISSLYDEFEADPDNLTTNQKIMLAENS